MRDYLEQAAGIRIPDPDWEMLSRITRQEEVPKGTLLIDEGTICRHLWFLREGAVRYSENIDGESKTTHFFTAPAMFTVYHSIVTGSPSELSIQAMEDLRLDVIAYRELKALYQKSHALERIGRIMAEHQFIAEFNRRRMHIHMDALERYEFLEKTQPEIFHRFQLKDIATYLGITPVSLSRLRKYRQKGGK